MKIVEKLLLENNGLRDDDFKLVANVWFAELASRGYNAAQMTGFALLQQYAVGKLTSADTITRQRRKLQEENVNLRGNKYQERQAKQSVVKKKLGY